VAYDQHDGVSSVHRGLPSPWMTMIVTVGAPLTMAANAYSPDSPGDFTTLIGGLHTRPAMITSDGFGGGIQVALKPLGARALFGMPGGELAQRDLSGTEVLGAHANDLHERFAAVTAAVTATATVTAALWDERALLLDEALLRRLDRELVVSSEVREAWRRLMVTAGSVGIRGLADHVGWSSRHLDNRFRLETGLGPKAAARLMRFDRARRLVARPGANFANVAAVSGYYDQAHLAREFREMAGCSPSRWLAEEFRNLQAGPMDGRRDSQS
jgi:AraC-like DNA-binding protein